MLSTLENIILRKPVNCEFIPLGMNCAPAHTLRKLGLRKSALPLDWNVTPISAAIDLIENNFEGFLDEENLSFLPSTPRLLFNEVGIELEMKNDIITPAYCKRYNILFPHDYPENHIQSIHLVKQKYNRRITKFRELLNSSKQLIFIHSDGALNDWQLEQYKAVGSEFVNNTGEWKNTLSKTLSLKYPNLQFNCLELPEFVQYMNMALSNVHAQANA